MDAERQREIARLGGRAAHRSGNAHQFDSHEAREAGRRGGEAVSRDRQHMAEIGARGGHNSHGGRAQRADANTGAHKRTDARDDQEQLSDEQVSGNTPVRPDDERHAGGTEPGGLRQLANDDGDSEARSDGRSHAGSASRG